IEISNMYVKFERYEHNLLFSGADDAKMGLLGHFFSDEIGVKRAPFFINCISDPQFDSIGSNYTFMERDGDLAIIGCLYDEDPYERALEVPVPIMIDLLEQWDAVCKTDPQEIIVTYQDGKFTVQRGHSI